MMKKNFFLIILMNCQICFLWIFLKGYQWPFDVNKIFGGSSVIDLLVYQETVFKKNAEYFWITGSIQETLEKDQKYVQIPIQLRELLVPVFKNGECVYDSPSVMKIRDYSKKELDTIWDETKRFANPQHVYVDLSDKLYKIKSDLLEKMSLEALEY